MDELTGRRLGAVSVGVALCIAATEVQRYTALWPVGTLDPVTKYTTLIVFLIAAMVGLLAVHRRTGAAYRQVWLLVVLGLISAAGVMARIAITFGSSAASAPLAIVAALGMEAPYVLMVLYAAALMRYGFRGAMRAVAAGIAGAGGIQILVSLFATTPVAYALVFLLAPAACVALLRLGREGEDPAPTARPLPSGDLAGPWVESRALAGIALAMVALTSLVVYVVHSRWVGIQDMAGASLLVQLCAGTGTLLTGNILFFAAPYVRRRSLFSFCFMLILPVAVVALYVTAVVEGTAVAVATVPLNIVYGTLLFFVWVMPCAYRSWLQPFALAVAAFLLKRLGILVASLLFAAVKVIGTVDPTWLTIAVLAALIVLDVAYYLLSHGDPGGAEAAAPGVSDPYAQACEAIADEYGLTPRERETLLLLGRGRTARIIGPALGMSDATVKTHIAHIYRKLGVNSQQALLDVVEERAAQG